MTGSKETVSGRDGLLSSKEFDNRGDGGGNGGCDGGDRTWKDVFGESHVRGLGVSSIRLHGRKN